MTPAINPAQQCQHHLLPGTSPTSISNSHSSNLDPNSLMIRVAIKTWKAKVMRLNSYKIRTGKSWRMCSSSHVNRVMHLRRSNRSRTITSSQSTKHPHSSHKPLICSPNSSSSQLSTNSPNSRHPLLSSSLLCPRLPTTSPNTMLLT